MRTALEHAIECLTPFWNYKGVKLPEGFIRRRFEGFSEFLNDIPGELLMIFEQPGRSLGERKEILRNDLNELLNRWKYIQDLAEEYKKQGVEACEVRKLEDEESQSRIELTLYLEELSAIKTLIQMHLDNTAGVGVCLEDEVIRELFTSLPGDFLQQRLRHLLNPMDVGDAGNSSYEELPTPKGTDQEQIVFRKAIESGLMERDGEKYKWTGRPCHLGCLVYKLYPTSSPPYLDQWFGKKRVSKYKSEYSVEKPQQGCYIQVLNLFS